jgi:predicted lysophospholipase L1 biosynthesis ABC-type transport system permease subunit
VIVNDALARKFFPGASAVGGQLRMADSVYTIVGVVGDVRQAGLDVPPLMEMHFPVTDTMMANGGGDMTIVLKTAVDPASVAPALRAAVRAVDPDQPIYLVRTMDEVIQHSLSGRQLDLWLLGIFASIALVLSAAGLYGVISYLVAQRTRELGIRMALGAQQEHVVALVMRRGSALIVVGIALGLLGALALTRLLQNLLYGVSARDPLTFGAIAALLAVVALVATYLPARRAARVDPLTAIRSE